MSRMVRDNHGAGLRERLYFARLLLDELDATVDAGDDRARALALRGAVITHLYSVPVGLLRRAAAAYQVPAAEDRISLALLAEAFRAADVEAPEVVLVEQARRDPMDPLAWLDEQMRSAFNTPAMGRRPDPPREDDALMLQTEDPAEPLGPRDRQRLRRCLERLDRLRRECEPHAEEW